MKKVICFYMLIILSLVSCTATAEQIPTSTPVLSSTPTETLVPITTPTNTPDATQTETSYLVQPLILKAQKDLVDTRINPIVSSVIKVPSLIGPNGSQG